MKKQVYKGWVVKSDSKHHFFDHDGDQLFFCAEAYRTRGRKDQYSDWDWPPVRVKITVEVEEG